MADFTVKNIPPALHAKLQTEAERSFRSVNQEILYRLQRSFDADDARLSAWHARWVLEALNSGEAKPLTESEVDAAIDRGVKRAKARTQAVAA